MSPCLFNIHAVYIVKNARLDEAQAGIKIAGRNIDNFRYADGITLMAENKEELKSLLMKVKEMNEKSDLNSTFKKQRSWHLVPITSWQVDEETMERVTDFIFRELQNHCR